VTPAGPASPRRIRVWDLPTRLFHWLLLACAVGSLVSVNLGGNAVGWHFRFGYAILTLLLFRLLWGFVGPRYARFASFPPSPAAAIAWMRGARAAWPGHNPVGAFSVYAMLAALALQAVTGLFATDDIATDGPLRYLVSGATSSRLTTIHRYGINVLMALVALHLVAIAFYLVVKRDNLARAMVTGKKTLAPGDAAPAPGPQGSSLVAALLFAVALALVFGLLAAFGR